MTRQVPDPMLEPTITVARAAEILGVGIRTGYLAVERGEWPVIRVGKAIRVVTAKLLAQYDLKQEHVPAA